MKLLKDTIMVRVDTAGLKSQIIYIPETADKGYVHSVEAKVLEIGSEFCHKDLVKVGDVVIVPNHLGNRHFINGEEVRIYDGEDVLAILSDKAP